MMNPFIKTLLGVCLTAVLVGAGGCATHPKAPPPASASIPARAPVSTAAPASAAAPTPAAAPVAENYPYSELEKVYETTLVDMVGRHFESDPKVAWQHAAAMEQFVRTSRPKAEFAAAMAKGVETEFDRARTDPDYRESEGFQRVLNGRVKRAERLATAIFAGRFDVYQRKIAYPDSLTRDLFPMAEGLGRDTDEIVAWIVGEIPLETYRQQPQHMGIQDGDRVFEFRSSELIWQQGLGNRGILLVRGNKIVGVQTFTSN